MHSKTPHVQRIERIARELGQENPDLPHMDRDYLLWKDDWRAISQARPELASQLLEVTSGSQRKANFEICLQELDVPQLYAQPQSVLALLDYVSGRQGDVRAHLTKVLETAMLLMVINPVGHPDRVNAKRLIGDLVNQYNLLGRSDLGDNRKIGYTAMAFEYLLDYVQGRMLDSGEMMDPEVEYHIRASCREVFEPLQKAGALDGDGPGGAGKPWRVACEKNKKLNGCARSILWGLMDLGVDWESYLDQINTASLAAIEHHPSWAKARLSDIAQASRPTGDGSPTPAKRKF